MKRYICLLRGVNISGKNKLPMAELKRGLEELGYSEIVTYLNSGNVVFSSASKDGAALSLEIRELIKERFSLDIPTLVLEREALRDILAHAPDWWGGEGKEIYDNLIFLLPPLTTEELERELGEPRAEYEREAPYKSAVFWSFDRKNYQKTNWWSKTASLPVGGCITIRTANTVRKLASL